MKIVLPLISILISFFVFAPLVLADSNLEVSDRSDFGTAVRNFSAGQTIFLRINSSGTGVVTSSKLNLRDSQYAMVNSFSLKRDGNYFSVIIPAPYGAGYYSLEATIEGNGSNVTSVKSIKVGEVSGASVKVNVNSKVQGQSISSSSQNESNNDSDESQGSPPTNPQVNFSPKPTAAVNVERGFWARAGNFFKDIFDVVSSPFRFFSF